VKDCREIVSRLGAYADGELPEDERGLVASHLRSCASCSDRLRLLAAQGAALRERIVARGAGRDLSGLADRVMALVAVEQRPAPLQRLPVWTSELWGAHRAAFAAAGSLALAACLALAMILKPDAGDSAAMIQAEVATADAFAPQVDEVDFGGHAGAVMQLRDRTPVIWLGREHPE
jgi:anti-sigma factor RsiW